MKYFLILIFCVITSCNKEHKLDMDISNIERIKLKNMGYDKIDLMDELIIKNPEKIKDLLSTLSTSETSEYIPIGSNYGYINIICSDKNGNEILLSNTYSTYNGVVSMYEDSSRVFSFRNERFVQKVEELLYDSSQTDKLLDGIEKRMDSINQKKSSSH